MNDSTVNFQSVLTFSFCQIYYRTVETAKGTDVRHSAGNFGVSEVQQFCTGARVPLKLTSTQVSC